MNRNVESHFANLPSIDIQRSIFDRSFTHKTSFNVGELIPFFVDQVLPGDTFKVKTSTVIRLQTLLTPVMDNLYFDIYYFFSPDYLAWDHEAEFFGENNESAWAPSVEYSVPVIVPPQGGFKTGTLADYMGLPINTEWLATDPLAPSALPFRHYARICNDFFRDENLTDPLNIPTGDSNQQGTNGTGNYINDVVAGGPPFKVAKYHDYFTSCLPSAQKATEPVTFPLLSGSKAPVEPYDEYTPYVRDSAMKWRNCVNGDPVTGNGVIGHSTIDTIAGSTSLGTPGVYMQPANLWADLSTNVGAVSINELRLAFQLQRFYERNARGGTRYTELIKSHFGVSAPDSRLHRPEYLGGNRVPVQIHEVTNTAQSQQDFLGDLGAMSVTANVNEDFTYSSVCHGYIIGVCCLRYDHSYPQGLERFWMRKKKTDFYFPVFANIGEQPVYQAEICATSSNINDETVFGFNEAYADYRFKPDRCSGEMRPGIQNTLASWHFADYYQSPPTLSDSWIREDKTNVDRTLAVTSANANQCFMDVYVKNICTRPMPMYSIPGLIDHH